MTLQATQFPLEVIGFNAIFNDLENIDQVEACLYRGKPLTPSKPLTDSYSDLCKRCANLVLSKNNLTAAQVAVLLVDENSTVNIDGAQQVHNSYQRVSDLSEALHRSEQLTNDDVAVLIISASLPKQIVVNEKATICFDQAFQGYAQLQGAACLLLCNRIFAKKNHSVVYANINNVVTDSGLRQGTMAEVINRSLSLACIDANNPINALETSASVNTQLGDLEQQVLIKSYAVACNGNTLTTALSCQKSVLGDNGKVSQLMGLIHSVICLQQRYRAGISDWQSPNKDKLTAWLNSPFYLFNQAAPVFPNSNHKPVTNAFSLLTANRYSHIVLTACDKGEVHTNGFNQHSPQTLFIVAGNSETQLLAKLDSLVNHDKSDFKGLAKQCYLQAQKEDCVYRLVLIADSQAELQKELALSLLGVKQAFAEQSDWKTPKGSYFTSVPEKNAKRAFLYPGIGATYIGLGRDLFHLFPDIYPSVIALADNIGASLKDELLNPRSVVSLGFKELKKLDLELRNSLANIAECGVGYACVFTKIFEQVFKLQADFASGYSMGEVSMFAALGCWQKPGLMSARLAASDTFNHQLSSELRAIRKLWNLPDINDGEFEHIWETYTIKGTAEQVAAAIKPNERVYITIINTPDSLVIGGFPEHCLQVIKRLGVRAMPLNMANAIHSEPAYQEYENMLPLYSMAVTERIPTKMISSSCYLPIPQLEKAIAVSIAKCLCEQVDFPRLINTLADKGSKVFIEMGAGRSLSSWTDKILAAGDHENHISVSINAKGTDDQLTYARAVAKLVSFGCAINIESFFSGSLLQQVNAAHKKL